MRRAWRTTSARSTRSTHDDADFQGPVLSSGFPSGHTTGPSLDVAARRHRRRVDKPAHLPSSSRKRPLSDSKRIHLIGVCGTAMATLAALLKSRGHDRSGIGSERLPADE